MQYVIAILKFWLPLETAVDFNTADHACPRRLILYALQNALLYAGSRLGARLLSKAVAVPTPVATPPIR